MAWLFPLEFIQKYPSKNNHYIQTKDVLFNPQNPVNPDSEPCVSGKISPIKPLLRNLISIGHNHRKSSLFYPLPSQKHISPMNKVA
jgi:hypothetical protein